MNRLIAVGLVVPVVLLSGCCRRADRLNGDLPPTAPTRAVDPLLDAMTGKWVARGTILGAQRVDDIEVKWVLDGRYLQMHELSENKDAVGKSVYEAIVLMELDPKTREYNCLWLDTTANGGLGPNHIVGQGKNEGDSIALIFKSSNGDNFHTSFVCNRSENTWSWILDGESNGKLDPFARMTLTKAPSRQVLIK